MEEVELKIQAFKVTTVFDIEQTEGKELPEIATELKNDVEGYLNFFKALEKTSPVPIHFLPLSGGVHGYYNLEEKTVTIDESMSEEQTVKTCIHEISHAILHDRDTGLEKDNQPDRLTREVQAESVAYTVCSHFGIDTSEYSFGYIAGWSSGRELSELKASMNVIRNTAADLINSIEKNLHPELAEEQPEQNKETNAENPETHPEDTENPEQPEKDKSEKKQLEKKETADQKQDAVKKKTGKKHRHR